jgi:hypothetical protein
LRDVLRERESEPPRQRRDDARVLATEQVILEAGLWHQAFA